MISGDPKTDMTVSAPDNSRYTSRAKSQGEVHPSIKGVKILGFRAESSAREAGMQEGDVIIEYDGEGNLTTQTLVGLTKMTKPEGIQVRVVLVRNGESRSMTLQRGYLGISAMDTAIQSPFRIPESTPGISPIHVAPWTPRDAWSMTGLFILFQHLLPLSLEMSHVPETLCIFMALASKRIGWEAFGFRKFNRNAVKLGCKLLVLLYLINGVHNELLNYFGLTTYSYEVSGHLYAHQLLWRMLPVIIIIGPVNEEIIFRGLLFAGFRQRYGWETAAAISSGLFALSHMRFNAVIPAFAFGYISAYLYQRTGSIWPGILMHCFINTVGVCASLVRLGGI